MKTTLTFIILTIFTILLQGCAITGEAEDQWDIEEKEDKISLDKLFKSKDKKKQEALEARIEQLEKEKNSTSSVSGNTNVNQLPATSGRNLGGVTPPSMNRGASTGSGASSNSVSYQEYLRAKNSGSSEYKDFKEYQEWLEFKRQKQQ